MGTGRNGVRSATAALVVVTALAAAAGPAHALVGSTPAPSWRVDGRVSATVVVGDTVVVGGTFANAISPTGQVVPRRNLAAFSMSTGALVTTWRADARNSVSALTTDGVSVWAGGQFTSIGGVARNRVAKLDAATGAVDPAFRTSPDVEVKALDVAGGRLFLGGRFTTVDGVPRTRLAAVDAATGALDPVFAATANGDVLGVRASLATGRLYVAGRFNRLSGATRTGVGGVSTTTGAVSGPAFASSAAPSFAVDVNADGSRVFGAGGGAGNTMSAWNATTGAQVWRQRADGDIQATRFFDGRVWFGFHDGFQGDTTLKLLVADAVTGALDPDFRPHFNQFFGIFAIAATPAGVVAGGDFTRVDGVAAQGWVRFPDR